MKKVIAILMLCHISLMSRSSIPSEPPASPALEQWEMYFLNGSDYVDKSLRDWIDRVPREAFVEATTNAMAQTKNETVRAFAWRTLGMMGIPLRPYRELMLRSVKAAQVGNRYFAEDMMRCAGEALLPEEIHALADLAANIADDDYRSKRIAVEVIADTGDATALRKLKVLYARWLEDEPAKNERVRQRYSQLKHVHIDDDTFEDIVVRQGRRLLDDVARDIKKMEDRLTGGASPAIQDPARAASSPSSHLRSTPTSSNSERYKSSLFPWLLGGIVLLLSAAAVGIRFLLNKRAK